MHDPLPPVGRQIDLLMAGHILQRARRWLLHEAEAQFDADDAAALLVAVEYRDPIAILVDVGDLPVDHLDEDQVARQDP